MNMQKQITEYIATQPEPKRSEMQELHDIILALMPTCKLWFLDGKDEKGKPFPTQTLGQELGKASVTGYCIKFKTLADIKVDVLKTAIQYGIGQTSIQH